MKYFVLSFLLVSVLIIQSCSENNSHANKSTNTSQEPSTEIDGEALFISHCKQCHLPKDEFMAPALAGVESRWEKKEDLYAFVKNSQEVIIRNKYAKALFEKWKNAPMLPFPNLSHAEIDAILAYCNQ